MIGIVIQARMGSTRLPGKIMKKIGNYTLLEHIINRVQTVKVPNKIVIATSDRIEDDYVEEFCLQKGIVCFRGSESNVLERYYMAAKQYSFQHIVRLTGDNPYTDVEELDNLINLHINSQNDFTESFSNLPIGVGAEVFSYSALEQDYFNATLPHHFEHVDEYILENLSEFKAGILEVIEKKKRPDIRLTVDTQEDYDKICYIENHHKEEFISTEEAIALCLLYA